MGGQDENADTIRLSRAWSRRKRFAARQIETDIKVLGGGNTTFRVAVAYGTSGVKSKMPPRQARQIDSCDNEFGHARNFAVCQLGTREGSGLRWNGKTRLPDWYTQPVKILAKWHSLREGQSPVLDR